MLISYLTTFFAAKTSESTTLGTVKLMTPSGTAAVNRDEDNGGWFLFIVIIGAFAGILVILVIVVVVLLVWRRKKKRKQSKRYSNCLLGIQNF